MGVCTSNALNKISGPFAKDKANATMLQKRTIIIPGADHAIQKLQEFYSEEQELIPKKIDLYYKHVLDNTYTRIPAIIVKVTHLGQTGIELLCRIMPFYAHAEELRLWKVGLDPSATDRLSYYLPFLTKLERLSLEDNNLNDEAVGNLCRALKSLGTVKEMWLSCNSISAEGAVSLASNIKHLPKLQILNLDFNHLEDRGCKAICDALSSIRTLSDLSMEANGISDLSTDALLALAHSSPPSRLLNLKGNRFTEVPCRRLTLEFTPEKIDVSQQCD